MSNDQPSDRRLDQIGDGFGDGSRPPADNHPAHPTRPPCYRTSWPATEKQVDREPWIMTRPLPCYLLIAFAVLSSCNSSGRDERPGSEPQTESTASPTPPTVYPEPAIVYSRGEGTIGSEHVYRVCDDWKRAVYVYSGPSGRGGLAVVPNAPECVYQTPLRNPR